MKIKPCLKFIIDQQAEDIELPENLRLNTFLQEFHSDCDHSECDFGFYGFAFGQSPFPVPKIVQEALSKNSDKQIKLNDVPTRKPNDKETLIMDPIHGFIDISQYPVLKEII